RYNLLGGWMKGSVGLHEGMWVVYLTIALVGCLGLLLRRWRSAPAVAACTLSGSVGFFLGTDFAGWVGSRVQYAHTVDGLLLCYAAALPFFGWTLAGDAFFATVLFGGFALAERFYPALRRQPVTG